MEKLIKKANILIEALPYIQKLNGKTVVIKYGGNAMITETLRHSVMEDITLLKFIGLKPIVVHGGGPDINSALKLRGVESTFINGLRVTDLETVETAQMVLVGKTNKQIVSLLCLKGGKAIGLCGIDGHLIECEKLMPTVDDQQVDLGYVGSISKIETKLLDLIRDDEYIPVIAPIGVDKDGQSYNINADTVASAVAAATKAEKLMLLTDTEGVKDKEDNIIYEITKDEILSHIDNGIITDGMIPKVLSCVEAIEQGVNSVHIIDGRIPHCILLEIFTHQGIGTMIKS